MDKIDLWKKAANLRKQLGEDATSPIDIFALAHSIERLSMVFYPMGDHLSGMCIKSDNNAVIAINSSMSIGRQRFSMAHEFFHLYYDDQLTSICAKKIGIGKDKENQADQFASYLLMPPDALANMIKSLIKRLSFPTHKNADKQSQSKKSESVNQFASSGFIAIDKIRSIR